MTQSQTSTEPRGVMIELKERTQTLHTETERHPVQRGIMSGQLPREAYASVLEQSLPLHRAISTRLEQLRGDDRFGALVFEEAFLHPHVIEDIAFFGGSADAEAGAAATSAAERVLAADALEVIGSHYVLEGAKNGGRFIAKALRKVYQLEGTDGTRSLDPHGDEQMPIWQRFKGAMGEAGFNEAEIGSIVAGAEATFRDMIAIFDELAEQPAIKPVADRLAAAPAGAPHH